MKALAIDCATDIVSVALGAELELTGGASDCANTYSIAVDAGRLHSELLFTLVDSLFNAARLKPEDIDIFVCQRGPGSWTGLRIGFAAVKGFALALQKPYISIPTLDCIAHFAPQTTREENFEGLVLPVLDAKQQRFFCALYENGARITDYLDAAPETIAALIPSGKNIWLSGDAAGMILPRLQNLLGEKREGKIVLDPHFRRGRAEDLLKFLAKNPNLIKKIKKIQKIEKSETEESSSSAPLYLRKSDAEINLDRKEIERNAVKHGQT
jgi:tRNA threonylcarbamoyladenosine biosynthesis protein TsaB